LRKEALPPCDASPHDPDPLDWRGERVFHSWLVRHAKSHVKAAPFEATTAQPNPLAVALALKALESICGLKPRSTTKRSAVLINSSSRPITERADRLRVKVFTNPSLVQVVSCPAVHRESVEPEAPS